MPEQKKRRFKNQLAIIRQRKNIEKKQIAALLGHKSIQQISRYENGVKIPNLRIALKLAQIYGIPIREMLDGYFEACREEVRRQEDRLKFTIKLTAQNDVPPPDSDYCTFENVLLGDHIDKATFFKIRRHSALLVRKTAEKLGHF